MQSITRRERDEHVRTSRDLTADDARHYVDLVMDEAEKVAAIINPDPEGCTVTIEVRAIVEYAGSRADLNYRTVSHVADGQWFSSAGRREPAA